jgi:ABC-2 type transport system permease protein
MKNKSRNIEFRRIVMSTASSVYPSQSLRPARTFAGLATMFSKETKYEFLSRLRTKQFSIATIGFPVMFYVIFGIANRRTVDGDVHIAKAMLGGYACFGLVGAALFGIGVGMAGEIAAGWLEVKRASPMPPMAYLFAKCMASIAFVWIIVSILIAISVLFGGVSTTPIEIAKMLTVSVAGSVAFASMGLLLAQLVPANAAPGIVNLIYLPMSFVSGLWVPFQYLPHWVQKVAPFVPTYHLLQLMESIYGHGYTTGGASLASHWFGLIGFTCLMLGLGWAVFNRSQQQA